jgi:hypothetical protein
MELLNLVVDMDLSDEDDIDFEDISTVNNRSEEENKRRWNILQKGLGGI